MLFLCKYVFNEFFRYIKAFIDAFIGIATYEALGIYNVIVMLRI